MFLNNLLYILFLCDKAWGEGHVKCLITSSAKYMVGRWNYSQKSHTYGIRYSSGLILVCQIINPGSNYIRLILSARVLKV